MINLKKSQTDKRKGKLSLGSWSKNIAQKFWISSCPRMALSEVNRPSCFGFNIGLWWKGDLEEVQSFSVCRIDAVPLRFPILGEHTRFQASSP